MTWAFIGGTLFGLFVAVFAVFGLLMWLACDEEKHDDR